MQAEQEMSRIAGRDPRTSRAMLLEVGHWLARCSAAWHRVHQEFDGF